MYPLYRAILLLVACLLVPAHPAKAWGFFAHERINRLAVFSLPPEMMVFFKPHIEHIVQQSTAPDKRRYILAAEGPRHYLDADHYGQAPFPAIPRSWREAVAKFTADTLQRYGILPWHLETMMARLTAAFQAKDGTRILRLAAELGHYMGDAHVPLHACSNHNGQFTGQHGIHGLWESRIPELLADQTFDLWTGPADYIKNCRELIWQVITASAQAADTVLQLEKELSLRFPADQRYAYELRKGTLVRNYSTAYTKAYHRSLGDMVERRMRAAIAAVAACWYTAWVDAGQPPLHSLTILLPDKSAIQRLDSLWQHGKIFDREHQD